MYTRTLQSQKTRRIGTDESNYEPEPMPERCCVGCGVAVEQGEHCITCLTIGVVEGDFIPI
jgi:hypothetical protein